MPRKRRIGKVAHRVLSWADVGIGEQLDFFSGWRPLVGEYERSRSSWPSWAEYLADWSLVRAEALIEWAEDRGRLLDQYRGEVRRRAAALAELVHDFSSAAEGRRQHSAGLLAWAEGGLAKAEAETMPFAEEIFVAVAAGQAPEAASWSRRRRLDRAVAGLEPDGPEDGADLAGLA